MVVLIYTIPTAVALFSLAKVSLRMPPPLSYHWHAGHLPSSSFACIWRRTVPCGDSMGRSTLLALPGVACWTTGVGHLPGRDGGWDGVRRRRSATAGLHSVARGGPGRLSALRSASPRL